MDRNLTTRAMPVRGSTHSRTRASGYWLKTAATDSANTSGSPGRMCAKLPTSRLAAYAASEEVVVSDKTFLAVEIFCPRDKVVAGFRQGFRSFAIEFSVQKRRDVGDRFRDVLVARERDRGEQPLWVRPEL